MCSRGLLRLGRHLAMQNETAWCLYSTSAGSDFEIKGPSSEFLSSLSKGQMKQFERAKLEYQALGKADEPLPKLITDNQWRNLIETPRQDLRLKYLDYLYKKEQYKNWELEKKQSAPEDSDAGEKHRADYAERAAKGEILYKPGFNTIFTKYQKERRLPTYYSRMFLQSQLGAPKVVFDLSYLKNTFPQIRSLTLGQLGLCYSLNRSSRLPFELFFTNVDVDSKWWLEGLDSKLHFLDYEKRVYPCLETLVTPQSYLELFPKQNLVYLSPDSPYVMEKVDANDVYIIGGVVDKFGSIGHKATLYKARKDRIRAVRLPLDNFVKWERGNKKLSLNACLSILLKVNETNDWRRAIVESIPQRKLTQSTPEKAQRRKEFRERELFRLSLVQGLGTG